jgi:hypothetical protein
VHGRGAVAPRGARQRRPVAVVELARDRSNRLVDVGGRPTVAVADPKSTCAAEGSADSGGSSDGTPVPGKAEVGSERAGVAGVAATGAGATGGSVGLGFSFAWRSMSRGSFALRGLAAGDSTSRPSIDRPRAPNVAASTLRRWSGRRSIADTGADVGRRTAR